jgi:Fe2+ or Zn2+ uptake regulation protein
LKVVEYLCQNHIHPTVDQIYLSLKNSIPTLSKTTVYNILKTLVEAGLVKVITIDNNESRYDINTQMHGHLKCEKCGRIFDFNIQFISFSNDELKNFEISEKNVYFTGVCPKCIENTSQDYRS